MPVRNAARTLGDALASLSSQTFRDFDVLIYDDGSTDETPDLIERACRADRRFRRVDGPRVGIVGALERAIRVSDAPLLARMDGDDISHPRRLEETLQLLDASPRTAVASCLVAGFPEWGLGAGMARYVDWLNTRITAAQIAADMFVESPLCHPSVLMRREAVVSVGGYVDDGAPEDYGLWLRLHMAGFEMAKVPKVRLMWRDTPERLSRTDPRYGAARFLAIKTAVLSKMYLGSGREIAIWGAGKRGRQLSRAMEKLGYARRAFIDIDPKKVGRNLHGAPVLPPPENAVLLREQFLLVAVGTMGARELIRARLTDLGLVERRHFVCVS